MVAPAGRARCDHGGGGPDRGPRAGGLGAREREALNWAHFVVSLAVFRSEAMSEYAHVILPATAFTETEGTFVNLSGTWQSFGRRGACLRGCTSGAAGKADWNDDFLLAMVRAALSHP